MPAHGIPEKPSRNEDEYFLKLDAELIQQMRHRLDRERAETERRTHWMKCPKCGAGLDETEYHHLKVDRCPECHGMWFDAGEIAMLDQVKENRVADFIRDLFKGLPGK